MLVLQENGLKLGCIDQPSLQVCAIFGLSNAADRFSLDVYVIFCQGGKSRDCSFLFISCLFITDKVSYLEPIFENSLLKEITYVRIW